MRRPRFDPFTLGLILLCVGWTGQTLWFDRSFTDAGAATRHLLWQGDHWRMLTTMLLHGGLWHLFLNCLALYFIGPAVVRGAGGLVFLLTVLCSGLAGLAASLLTHPPDVMLVGISGGVLGLLGLILAVEWRHATSFTGFLRQRNTVVVIGFLVLNGLLAVAVEVFWPHIRIDHAAHLGGFGFGLIGCLVLFGRGRPRPGRAAVAVLLLVVVPLAYAAYPRWSKSDIVYLRKYASLARATGNRAKEQRLWEFILELDPGHPIAGARLAILLDDPGFFDGLREPVGDVEKRAVVAAHLQLASDRLASAPERARALAEAARRVRLDEAAVWIVFAKESLAAGLAELAALAYAEAAARMPESQSWEAARFALAYHLRSAREAGLSPQERLRRAEQAAGMALRAAGGLAEERLAEEERPRYEAAVATASRALSELAELLATVERPPGDLRDLYLALSKVWYRIGNNTDGSPRQADYFYRSAAFMWRAVEGPDVAPETLAEVANRYKAALGLARELGDSGLEGRIRGWYAGQRLPLPDLAEDGDGG